MDIKWSGSYSQIMNILIGTGVICQMITLGYSQGDPTGASCVTVVDGLPDGGRFTQSCSPLVFPCTGQRVAYVGDCGFYYWCTDRQILRCPCPTGTGFDISAGMCVRELNADCSCPVSATTSTTSTTSPKMTTSILSTSDLFISNMTNDPDVIEPDEEALASRTMIYIIVGVLVGIIVLVVVIVVVIIICRRRNYLSRLPSDKGSGTDNPNYGIRPYVNSNIITSSDGIYSTVNTQPPRPQPGYGSQQSSLTYSTVAKPTAPPASNATDSEPIRSWNAARNSEVAVMNEWNDPVYANS